MTAFAKNFFAAIGFVTWLGLIGYLVYEVVR